MSLFAARENLLIALILLLSSTPVRSGTPDQKLLGLVTPDTQIVAGVNPAPPGNRHGRFVLITRKSAKDLDDVRSLSDSDASLRIYQVIFAARSGELGTSEEHCVLLRTPSGTFSLLGSLNLHSNNDGSAQGTLKVSKKRYDQWLDEVSRRDLEIRSNGH